MINGRFAIHVHILTLLSAKEGELLSSEYIAGSININPVLVRKEISLLRKAGYVDSKEGKNGGFFLLKNPRDILFSELFTLVYDDPLLSFTKNDPNPNCPIGRQIHDQLGAVYLQAEQAMLAELSKTNLLKFCSQFSKEELA